MIIRSEVIGAGANALASFPGFTTGNLYKAWEGADERARMASRKMFGAKSGRAKVLPALPLAPELYIYPLKEFLGNLMIGDHFSGHINRSIFFVQKVLSTETEHYHQSNVHVQCMIDGANWGAPATDLYIVNSWPG